PRGGDDPARRAHQDLADAHVARRWLSRNRSIRRQRTRRRVWRRSAGNYRAAARGRQTDGGGRISARPDARARRTAGMSAAAVAPALADAARVVSRVAAGRSLAEELDSAERTTTRAALLDLTHGTLRRFGRVQAIVRELSHRGTSDALLEALLWCALYALESG